MYGIGKTAWLPAARALAIGVVAALMIASLAGTGAAMSQSNSGGGSWQYYKEIIVRENSGSTLTDYQILVLLSGSDFPANARSYGADIRFTDTGEKELSYWIESWDYDNKNAKIWVKIPSIPVSSTNIIRMYYGNPSARSTSNGETTFDFFDDFLGTTLNTAKWAQQNSAGGNLSISGGIITFTISKNLDYFWIHSLNTFAYPGWVEAKVTNFNPTGATLRMGESTSTTLNANWLYNYYNEYSADSYRGYYRIVGDSSTGSVTENQYGLSGTPTSETSGIWSFVWSATGAQRFDVNYVRKLTSTDTTNPIANYYFYLGLASDTAGNAQVDWARVRKYASSEPIVSLGAEQQTSIPTPTPTPISIAIQSETAKGWINLGIPGTQRDGMGYAYDSSRSRGVIFGGEDGSNTHSDSTFEWDGKSWKEILVSGPSPRVSIQMAYDAARREIILFGGWTRPDNYFGDTWIYNGYNWTLKSTLGPHARANNGLAYDKDRQKVVLFGGSYYQTIYGDTWEWDGISWKQVNKTGPSPRIYSRMVYDEARKKIVLFGGQTQYPGTLLDDTWEWDGSIWKQVANTGPSPRAAHQMAYDPVRRKVVLYGGGGWGISKLLDDTWEWDGSKWTKIDVSGPGALQSGAMFYDEANGHIVLFGGSDGKVAKSDTWAYLPLETTTSAPLELKTPAATTTTKTNTPTPIKTSERQTPAPPPTTAPSSVEPETNWLIIGGIGTLILLGILAISNWLFKKSERKIEGKTAEEWFELNPNDEKASKKKEILMYKLDEKEKEPFTPIEKLDTTSNKLVVLREFEFFNGFIRLKISVKNLMQQIAADVLLDLEHDEYILRLDHYEPAYGEKRGKILLGNIQPGNDRTIALYLDPLICAKEGTDVKCRIDYNDAYGRSDSLRMEALKIKVVCPLFSSEQDINIGRLKELVASLPAHGSKVFSLSKGVEIGEAMALCREIIQMHDVRHVRSFKTTDGKNYETWYYGRTKVEKIDLIIKASVSKETESIEIFVAAPDQKALTGLLAELGRNLTKRGEALGKLAPQFNITIKDSIIQRSNLLSFCDMNDVCGANVVIEDSLVLRSDIN